MRAQFILSLALLLLLLSVDGARAQQWSDQKTLAVDIKANEIMQAPKGPPSVSIGVSINGIPQLTKGYGIADASSGQAASDVTQYQIGSLTKQFTAAGILSIIDDSRRRGPIRGLILKPVFGLDARLDAVLPSAAQWMPKGPVTIRHLLNMQSGFNNFTNLNPAANGMPDTTSGISEAAMLTFINTMMTVRPQQFAPGTAYDYSNTNYFLLAEAAEKANGSFHTKLSERVFKRAGMTATGFLDGAPDTGSKARAPYDTSKSSWNKPNWPKGAGDVVSTVDDMLKWHAALMGGKVLSSASLKEMFKPVAVADAANGIHYGMGWFVVSVGGVDWYYHNGSIAGFTSFDSILLDTKTGHWTSSVVLTNQDDVKLDRVSACLVQLAMDNASKLADIGPVPKAFCQGL
jgi:CubicO group peptidase (beta-lactamase class C family)